MSKYLKQSTACHILFGPVVDKTDGVTLEVAAGIITSIDHATTGIFLSKNGEAGAIRSQAVTASVLDAYGMFQVHLSTTDTDTVGNLRVMMAEAATFLPVWDDYVVLPANVYNSLMGTDALDVSLIQVNGAAQTATLDTIKAETVLIVEDTGTTIPATLTTITGYLDTEVAAILAAVDTEVAAIKTVVDNIHDTDLPAVKSDTAAILVDTGTAGVIVASGTVTTVTNQQDVLTPLAVIDGIVDAILVDTGTTLDALIKDVPTNAELATALGTADDAVLAAIATAKGVLDNIHDTDLPAVKAETALIVEDTGTTLPATLATIAGYLDTEVAAILADTNELQVEFVDGGRLDLLIDAIKAKTDTIAAAPTAAAIADAVLDEATSGHVTAGSFSKAVIDILANTGTIITDMADVTDITTPLGVVDGIVDAIKAKTDQFAFTVANQVDANALTGGGGASAADVADAVLDEAMSGHVTAGTLGKAVADALADTNELQTDWVNGGRLDLLLDAAGSAGDPWTTALPGAYGAGTAGKIIGDNINAPIATVDTVVDAIYAEMVDVTDITTPLATIDTVVDAIKAKTDNLPASPANEATLTTIAGYLDTEVAAILADTNELQTDLVNGGRLDLLIDAIKAKTDTIAAAPTAAAIADAVLDEATAGHVGAGSFSKAVIDILEDTGTTIPATIVVIDDFLDTEVTAILAAVDTEVAAIKAKTDNLPTDPADQSAVEAAITAAHATTNGYIDTEVAAILADTNELQTDLVNGGRLDLLIDAIKAKSDLIPASPASAGEYTAAIAAIPTTPLLAANYTAPDNASIAAILVDTGTTLDALVKDIPTNTELATALGTADDAVLAAIATAKGVIDNLHDTDLPAVKAETAAIKAKTDLIPASPAPASEYDARMTAIQADLDNPAQYKADVSGLATATNLATVDTVVDAIKVTTDKFAFTVANQVDANALSGGGGGGLDAAGVRTAIGLASANLDTQLAAIVEDTGTTLDGIVDAIKLKTDLIPASPASAGEYTAAIAAIPTAPLLASGYTAPDNAGITAIKAKTDNLPANTATTLSAIQADLDNPDQYKANVTGLATAAAVAAIPTTPLLAANYVAPDNASVGAIKTKTDQLVFTTPNKVDASATVDTSGLATSTALSTVDGIVDAIKVKTDQLAFTEANRVDASATIDPTGLATSAALATVDGIVDAIKVKTDQLDFSSVTVVTSVIGSTITILRGDTLEAPLLNLGALTDYVSLDFTVKRSYGEADDDAIIRVRKNANGASDGLLRLNGTTHTTGTDGSITIDDAPTGDITLMLKATVTDDLTPGTYVYDIQLIEAAEVSTLTTGTLLVTADVTRLVA